MLSRSVGRSLANVFRNRRLFHQSIRYMGKDDAIQTYEFPNTSMKDGSDSTTMIKSARNSSEFLSVISKNVTYFSAAETLASLRTLFELQKDTTTSISQRDIAVNSDFERLCRSLKRNARKMELNDVIEALKIVSFVGVKGNSEITMSLLNLIKHQINEATLGHIIFLGYLLEQMESNPLVDALKIALPTLLQVQISTKIDHENVAQLIELLRFVSQRRVSDPCIRNICAALRLRGEDLSPEQARYVVWSLSSPTLSVPKEYLDKLMEDAIRAMSKEKFGAENILTIGTTLKKMINKYMHDPHEFDKFYNEAFFNKCADAVVMNDLGFEKATFIQRDLNNLGFVHLNMLKYMLQEIEKYPQLIIECKPTSFLTFIAALSSANYKPHNWDKIQQLIMRSNFITEEKRLNLPWTKVALELLSLGIECPTIWDKVFSNEFLAEHLTQRRRERLSRILELYQCLAITDYNVDGRIDEKFLTEAKMLQQSIQFPMQRYIEMAFGGPSFVCTRVRTKRSHVIHHVVAFDKKTMEPTQIDGGLNNDIYYEDIATDDSKQYIAVLAFPDRCFCINIPIMKATYELKLRTYEKMGIPAVPINLAMWKEMPDKEKIPYIQREVKFKVTQLQNVLQ
ncbi:uncharacterized protein LOC119072878 [Bradysia coprophila]|uniref:uncharacterized protein LOC119072878 n=1 Tax=Bradysia coprophila TaxID=38358 RepID=UPI00187DB025|nr:uncharacterized protein LOC119072878 [Bradysia coprophila]